MKDTITLDAETFDRLVDNAQCLDEVDDLYDLQEYNGGLSVVGKSVDSSGHLVLWLEDEGAYYKAPLFYYAVDEPVVFIRTKPVPVHRYRWM